MQASLNDSAPAVNAGEGNNAQGNKGILSVNQNNTAQAANSPSLPVLITEDFNETDLVSYLRSYLGTDYKLSTLEQLLGPLARIEPTEIEASINSALQTIDPRFINTVVDFDSDGNIVSAVHARSASQLWLGLLVTFSQNYVLC